MITRRALLAAGAATLATPAGAQDLRTLRGLAAGKGFVFGTAAASYELKDADFPPVLLAEATQIVPEYEMKRGALEPQPGRYDFSALDRLFAFASANGLSLRGHPLVWYTANPGWLKDALAAHRDDSGLPPSAPPISTSPFMRRAPPRPAPAWSTMISAASRAVPATIASAPTC